MTPATSTAVYALLDRGRPLAVPTMIAGAVLLGLYVPLPDRMAAATIPLVAVLVFAAVRGADGFVRSSDGSAIVTMGALLVVFVLPIAFAPVPTVILPESTRVGVLVAVAAPPTAGSAIVWTRRSGGAVTTTTVVAIAGIAIAPLLTPAVLFVTLGRGVAIDPVPLVRDLLFVVGGGFGLAWLLPADLTSTATLDRLSLAVIIGLIYVAVGTNPVGAVEFATLVSVGALAVGFLAFAAAIATGVRPIVGRALSVSLLYVSGLRNLGIGVAVATAIPLDGVVVTVTVFYVVQQLAAAVLAEVVRAGVAADREPSIRPDE